jgi:ferritin-like protein
MALAHEALGQDVEAMRCWTESRTFDHIVDAWANQSTQDHPTLELATRLLREEVRERIRGTAPQAN